MGGYDVRQLLKSSPMYIPIISYKLSDGSKAFMKNSINFKIPKLNFCLLGMISKIVLLLYSVS